MSAALAAPSGSDVRHAAPSAAVALAGSAIDVAFGQRRVLSGVSASVRAGMVTTIIGPNGAGKSTLLRVLAGVLKPDFGRVLLGHDDVHMISPAARAARLAFATSGTGSGAGGLAAAGALSVGQFAAIGGAGLLPPPTPEMACRAVGNALARVGLLDRATEPLGVLSSGLQQLATMARVLVQLDGATGPGEPDGAAESRSDLAGKIVILDEPTSAMDPRHVRLALRLLRGLAARGAAVLLATHDLSLACQCDRVLMLGSGGAVAADGPTDAVMTEEKLSAVYGVRFEVIARLGQRPVVLALL